MVYTMIKEDRKKVGNRLRFFRTLSGYNQDILSLMVGVSQKTIAAIEAGTHLPNLNARVNLSKIFGIHDLFLLEGRGNVFIDKCTYYRPSSLVEKNPKRYSEVEKELNYLVDFMKESLVNKSYEIEFEAKQQYGYVFEVGNSLMFVDVGGYQKLISSVLVNNNFAYETYIVKISEYEDVINFPSDSFLIYCFLDKKGDLKLFDQYTSYVRNRQDLKHKAFLEGLSQYLFTTLSDYNFPHKVYLNYLKSKWDIVNNAAAEEKVVENSPKVFKRIIRMEV